MVAAQWNLSWGSFLSQSLNLQGFSKSAECLAVLAFRNVRGSPFEPHPTNMSFMSPFVSSTDDIDKGPLNLITLIWAIDCSELCREVGKMLLEKSKPATGPYYNPFQTQGV